MDRVIIESVKAREILSGRGVPTVEVEISARGFRGVASSPSGASTSSHEAVELRDGGPRYMGKGVLQAIANVRERIAPAIIGMDVVDQQGIDRRMMELDGTPNKSNLGGNAIVAVSLAAAKAAAASQRMELYRYLGGKGPFKLPLLCPNMISGSKTAASGLGFEDYLLVPFGFSAFAEAVRAGVEVFHTLHRSLEKRFGPIAQVTALVAPLSSTKEAMDFLLDAISEAGYEGKIGIGFDVAAGLFYDSARGTYSLEGRELTAGELIAYYKDLARIYPISFIEDGLEENDFDGFAALTRQLNCLIVGDDLFATNRERLARGVAKGAANTILFKVNQAGTVTEAWETGRLARESGYTIFSSARSGETDDPAQADLAVAIGAKLMKVGCPLRGEMVAKYNRLLRIAEELGDGY